MLSTQLQKFQKPGLSCSHEYNCFPESCESSQGITQPEDGLGDSGRHGHSGSERGAHQAEATQQHHPFPMLPSPPHGPLTSPRAPGPTPCRVAGPGPLHLPLYPNETSPRRLQGQKDALSRELAAGCWLPERAGPKPGSAAQVHRGPRGVAL